MAECSANAKHIIPNYTERIVMAKANPTKAAAQQQGSAAASEPSMPVEAPTTAIAPTSGGGVNRALALKNSIQALDIGQWAIAAMSGGDSEDAADMALALQENLAGGTVGAFDFDRIRMPAGGALSWTIKDPETGKPQAVTEINGIIIFFKDQKSFWKTGLDESNAAPKPPDCFSVDTVVGVGDPGVVCARCAYNQFGSAKGGKGAGKACKDVRLLFLLRENDLLPVLLPAPPTSIKAVKDYMMFLSGRGVPYWQAVTKITLEGDQNAAKIDFSKLKLELVGRIDRSQLPGVRKFQTAFKNMISVPLLVRQDDLTGGASTAKAVVSTPVSGGDIPPNVDGTTGEVIDAEHTEPAGAGGNVL
jgi:hypothetical protein